MGIREKSFRAATIVAATVVPKNRRIGLVLLALLEGAVLAASALILVWEARATDKRLREETLNWVQAASLSFASEDVAALRANPADEQLGEYANIREALWEIRGAHGAMRFSYLLTLRDGVPTFLADSEPPESPDASRPGDPYLEATPELSAALASPKAFVEGPVSDQWGTWVSAFSPLPCVSAELNPVLLGVDVSASQWRWRLAEQIFLALMTVLSVNVIMVGFVVALVHVSRRAKRIAYSELRFKAIAARVSDWVWATDGDGCITYSSGRAMAIWGCAPEEMLGRPLTDYVPLEEAGGWPDALLFTRGGTERGARTVTRGPDGRPRTLLVRGGHLEDITGRIVGWQGAVTDITESARWEEKLKSRDRILNGAASASSALIALDSEDPVLEALRILGTAVGADRAFIFENVADPATGALFMSHRYEWAVAGVSSEINNPVLQRLPYEPDYARWRDALFARRSIKGTVREFPESERAVLQAQGIKSVLVVPIVLQGSVWGFLGLDDCRTERQWAAHEEDILIAVAASFGAAIERGRVEDSLRLIESALHHATDAVVITTAELDIPGPRIVYVNPAFSHITGYPAEEALGRTPRMLQGPETSEEFRRGVRKKLSSGEVFEGETTNYRKDGGPYTVELDISPVPGRNGQITHFVALQRDVTSRRRTENSLRQKTALLGAISAAQSGFILSGLLHESLSRLLEDILLLTESAFGFIGELSFDPSGAARLDIHAAMDCALDGEGRRACSRRPSGGVALEDMGALCGRPALSGRPVVFNGAGQEEAAGFLPGGHPPLTAFLGLPFLIGDEVVGMVGVSNRPEGYTQEMAAQLESFVTTCASLIGAHRGEQRRKAAEDALRESDERAHTVLNTIVEGIITVNEEFVVEVANPAAARMFGYLPEEMAGISVFTLMPELRKRTGGNSARTRLCPGSPDCSGVNRQIAAVAADGGEFFVELSMNETTAPDGGSLFTVSIRDITERLHTEAQLLEARAREESTRHRIQETLLFGHPPSTLRGVTVGMDTLPSDQMDGDFFDFFELAPGTMDLLVGDIMGKGTTAALLGAATKNHFLRALNLLNSELGGRVPSPAEILNRVNETVTPQLMRPGIEVFATLFYARFELESRHCVFVDCGHTKTIHCHADGGDCTELSGENLPLGILLEETYSDRRVPYDPGDVFVLYSDGITEAHDDAGRYFGVEGIWSALERCRFRDSREIVDELMRSVLEHSGSVGFSDDATCLVVKADALRTLEERMPASLGALAALRGLLRGFLSGAGGAVSSGETADKIELGLVEAFTNIVKHAYGGERGGQVLVRMELLPGGVCLRLEHDGPFFAPEKVAAPAVEELPENGYGLFLISQCFDTVDYFVTAGGRSAVILAAHFGSGRGAPPE